MNIYDIAQKSMENPYYEYDLLELITLISVKHDMFGCSDFMMVAAFIEGYVCSKEVLFVELKEFKVWLAVKLDFPENWAWFSGLADKYPTTYVISRV
jgi:hypothetical protein